MGKITILVDWSGKNFAARPMNEDIACIATGKTLDELQSNMQEALELHVRGLVEDAEPVPVELNGTILPEYLLTTRALLRWSENWITLKALSQETGINLRRCGTRVGSCGHDGRICFPLPFFLHFRQKRLC